MAVCIMARGKEPAVTSYVTCSKDTASKLLAASGASALFVGKLAKDKVVDEKVLPFWVPHPPEMTDLQYIK